MSNPIFTEITQAEYIDNYKLRVYFNNGECRIVDFYGLLFNKNYPVFLPLRDVNRFCNFKISDTIEWENGTVDIAPETVYEMGIPETVDSVAEPKEKYQTKNNNEI